MDLRRREEFRHLNRPRSTFRHTRLSAGSASTLRGPQRQDLSRSMSDMKIALVAGTGRPAREGPHEGAPSKASGCKDLWVSRSASLNQGNVMRHRPSFRDGGLRRRRHQCRNGVVYFLYRGVF